MKINIAEDAGYCFGVRDAVNLAYDTSNQYGKVYGIDNLRVADASIMPDCVRANMNVTVMTIAERVADFIVQGN